jgi:hypothetical protein
MAGPTGASAAGWRVRWPLTSTYPFPGSVSSCPPSRTVTTAAHSIAAISLVAQQGH